MKERILVIRLSALGDLVFCFQSFHEIRQAHPDAEIALLTRPAYAAFARAMPWIDRVILDTHPTLAQPAAWVRLASEIRSFAPHRIYDLQGRRRQSILYGLLGGPWGPDWSGAAPFCRFSRPWPPAPSMHFTDFLGAQLRTAGVAAAAPCDVSWCDASVDVFDLPASYVVLAPGCSPKAEHKRWPPENYAQLAGFIAAQGFGCVLIGTQEDVPQTGQIKAAQPEILDLTGRTNLFELAGILRRAACVIGNDTGPVHLGAALGTPTLALFSNATNPAWSKPPGKRVAWRQSASIADLPVKEAVFAFQLLVHPRSR